MDLANIYVCDGNYYALEVTTRLWLEGSCGMVRVGLVHHNTGEEFERFGEVMGRIEQVLPSRMAKRQRLLPALLAKQHTQSQGQY